MHSPLNDRTALRRRILAGLGLTSLVHAACVADAGPVGATATSTGADATTDATGEPTTAAAETSATSTAPTGPSTTADASTTTPDGGTSSGSSGSGAPDTDGTSSSSSTTTATSGGDATSTTGDATDVERCWYVVAMPCPDLDEAAAMFLCTDQFELVTAWLSGPVPMGDDQCCYHVDVAPPGGACVPPGRPFVVDGRARLAPVRASAGDWDARPVGRRAPTRPVTTPAVADLDAETRAPRPGVGARRCVRARQRRQLRQARARAARVRGAGRAGARGP